MAPTETLPSDEPLLIDPFATDKLPPLADLVFRRLFADMDLLCELVNDVLHREGGARIASLTLTDTQLLPAVADGKATVLDLIATCADGSAVTIEIQLSVRPSYVQRIIYYLMVTGSRRLAKGQTYTDLRPLIAIHFLGENLLSDETSGGAYHSTFELRHHQTGQRLTNLLSVHLIELARFPLKAPCSTSEAKWLTFLLRGQTMTPLEISALNLQAIEEADERLRELSTDWNLRLALVQLEKVERDRYCYLLDAQKEALQKGRDEGLKAGRDEGLKAGRDEGLKAGRRSALLDLLALRGLSLTPEQRARIAACDDLDQLNAWFAQALYCETAADLR